MRRKALRALRDDLEKEVASYEHSLSAAQKRVSGMRARICRVLYWIKKVVLGEDDHDYLKELEQRAYIEEYYKASKQKLHHVCQKLRLGRQTHKDRMKPTPVVFDIERGKRHAEGVCPLFTKEP